MDMLSRLNAWFDSQWEAEEHEDVMLKLESLDNPGWHLTVDVAWLKNMTLKDKIFEELSISRAEGDWIVARKDGTLLEIFGGIHNLDEMLLIFLDWAE